MDNFQRNSKKNNLSNHKLQRRRMPVWMMVLADIFLAAVCLGLFSLYQIVLPHKLSTNGVVVASANDTDGDTFRLPDSNSGSGNTVNSGSNQNSNTSINSNGSNSNYNINMGRAPRTGGGYTNYGNTDTDRIASDTSEASTINSEKKVKTKVNSYQSSHVELTTNKVELGSGNDKITYYSSDIFVTNVRYLKTAFATGTYGRNLKDWANAMAAQNNAILAISGDYYGNSETSTVIRNGILYRSAGNDADVCVLFTDGTMKAYSPSSFNAKKLIKKGAWQAWNFGPSLLDGKGNILKSFNTTDYIYSQNPRCAIGYVEPGHYVFVVVDGRNPGYSKGATLNELAQIMADEGCRTAYNLDGGKSASMVYKNDYVNQPSQGGREISDIIYIGE